MLKTYVESCHYKAVRCEVGMDLESGTNKCNCSICTKTRSWNAIVKPDAFRLFQGEDALSDYQFGPKLGHHLFCQNCGVHAFARGYVEQIGGHYVAVQPASLDNATAQELLAAPVRYANGREDDWGTAPAEIRHL